MRSKLTLESGHSVATSDTGLRVELDLGFREFVLMCRMLSTGDTKTLAEAEQYGVDLRKILRDFAAINEELGDLTSAAPEVLQ